MGLPQGGSSLGSPTLCKGAGLSTSSCSVCSSHTGPPGVAAHGRLSARVPEWQRGRSRLAAGRGGGRSLEAGSGWGLGARARGRIGPDSCRLETPRAAILVSRASAQPGCSAVASGAALKPADPSRAATAAAVAAAAGLGYLSDCVSGPRPPISGRLAPLKLLGGRGGQDSTLGEGEGS